jgi:hypothetical protein
MSGEVTPSPADLSLRSSDLQPYGTTVSEEGKVESTQPDQPPRSESGKDPNQEIPTIEDTGDDSASPPAKDKNLNEDNTEDAGSPADAGLPPTEPENGKIRLTPETYALLNDKEKFEYELAEAKILVAAEKNNGTNISAEEGQISEAVAGIGDNPDSDQLKALLKTLSTIAERDGGNKILAQEAYSRISEDITVIFDGETWSLKKLDEIYGTADEAKKKEIDKIKAEGSWGHKYLKKSEKDTRTDSQVIDDELDTRINKLQKRLKSLGEKDPKRKKIEEQLDALNLAKPANGELSVLAKGGALRAVNDALISEFGVGLSERVMQSIKAEEDVATAKFMAIMNSRGLNAVQQGQLMEYVQSGRIREFLSQKGIIDTKLINGIYGENFKTESEANEFLANKLSPAQYAELKKLGKRIGWAAIILLVSGKLIAGVGNEMAFDKQR